MVAIELDIVTLQFAIVETIVGILGLLVVLHSGEFKNVVGRKVPVHLGSPAREYVFIHSPCLRTIGRRNCRSPGRSQTLQVAKDAGTFTVRFGLLSIDKEKQAVLNQRTTQIKAIVYAAGRVLRLIRI